MTTEQLTACLPEYVLGTLPPEEMQAVETFLERNPSAWALVEAYEAVLAELALARPPVKPRHAARTRLLAAAEPRPRSEGLAERMAGFLDVGRDAARKILSLLDDAAAWIATPLPGVTLCDVEGGAAVAGARVGLVRIAPGVTFPHHTHYGDEHSLILQGAYRDSGGRVLRRGDIDHLPPDSDHDFTALEGADLIFAVVLYKGISLPNFE